MKHKLWWLHFPLLAFFVACYWISEQGIQGNLDNRFLRETIFPALSRPNNMLTDLKFKARGYENPKNKIVVLEIDSPALETMGRWPWHRDVMAYLIEKTFLAGAKVVGLDMIFSEPDRRVPQELAEILKGQHMPTDRFETDNQLEGVINKYSDRLVIAWMSELACQPYYEEAQFCPVTDPGAIAQFPPGFNKFAMDQFNFQNLFDPSRTPLVSFVTPIANIPLFTSVAKHMGYLNAFLDSDGYIRRSSLVAFGKGQPYPSLPLAMARVGLGEKLQINFDAKERVQSLLFANSGKTIPVTPLGALQINFRGPGQTFPHIAALDVLSDKDTLDDPLNRKLAGLSKTDIFKDAYVLIGLSALGVFDMRQFPFESNAPGVDGHANILDNILSGDPLFSEASGHGILWIFLLMILGVGLFAVATEKLDAVPALALFLTVFCGIGYWDFKLMFRNNYNWNTSFLYIEIAVVFILTLAAKYILEERNKKFIRGAFAKYVPSSVVDSILKDPSKLSLGGEKRELTILFSDIRGFTTFSEKMDAKALAAFLNDYLGIMTGIVFANQGTLDKYIGDAVMAFWGAPLSNPAHAAHACKAAAEMIAALDKNRERFKSQYGVEVNIGIGLNSGVVNVGNMGSEQNFEYTVIGDHVNLASRLEGMTKKYGAEIMSSRFTADSITQSGQELPLHRIVDDVKVKGKKNAVQLIQLLTRQYSEEGLKLFAEGRELYQKKKWDQATETLKKANQLLAIDANTPDGPSEIFIERCQIFKKEPPEADWDGSWEMDSK